MWGDKEKRKTNEEKKMIGKGVQNGMSREPPSPCDI